MTKYEELLTMADSLGLDVREKAIPGFSGLAYKKRIAIRKTLPTSTHKACVLAEEIGHHVLTSGNILDQTVDENRKQEHKARRWAYKTLISQNDIVEAAKHGCRNLFETANYLEVTEEFLEEAISDFRRQYGEATTCGNYLIVYEPGLYVYDLRDIEA